jgi:hypothetical protein
MTHRHPWNDAQTPVGRCTATHTHPLRCSTAHVTPFVALSRRTWEAHGTLAYLRHLQSIPHIAKHPAHCKSIPHGAPATHCRGNTGVVPGHTPSSSPAAAAVMPTQTAQDNTHKHTPHKQSCHAPAPAVLCVHARSAVVCGCVWSHVAPHNMRMEGWGFNSPDRQADRQASGMMTNTAPCDDTRQHHHKSQASLHCGLVCTKGGGLCLLAPHARTHARTRRSLSPPPSLTTQPWTTLGDLGAATLKHSVVSTLSCQHHHHSPPGAGGTAALQPPSEKAGGWFIGMWRKGGGGFPTHTQQLLLWVPGHADTSPDVSTCFALCKDQAGIHTSLKTHGSHTPTKQDTLPVLVPRAPMPCPHTHHRRNAHAIHPSHNSWS